MTVWRAPTRPSDVTVHAGRRPARERGDGHGRAHQGTGRASAATLTSPDLAASSQPGRCTVPGLLSGWPASRSGRTSRSGPPGRYSGPAGDSRPRGDAYELLQGPRRPADAGPRRMTIAEAVAANAPDARPHLLVLSGDQIYADEVRRRSRLGSAGWPTSSGSTRRRPSAPCPPRRPPSPGRNVRALVERDVRPPLGIGEYYAQYLLAVGPALARCAPDLGGGPADLDAASGPTRRAGTTCATPAGYSGQPAQGWRLLATVPSLMIRTTTRSRTTGTDHDWATAVYGDPRASRIVANGSSRTSCSSIGATCRNGATGGTTEARSCGATCRRHCSTRPRCAAFMCREGRRKPTDRVADPASGRCATMRPRSRRLSTAHRAPDERTVRESSARTRPPRGSRLRRSR